jgi:hypothetical protein
LAIPYFCVSPDAVSGGKYLQLLFLFSFSAIVTPLLPFLKRQSHDMAFFMGRMQLSF